jgi:trans-2,3-dihydro-3-hydroxyanthranilate isomerase
MLDRVPRTYPFVQVDVFTDRIFGGNQLAVFLEPEGLSDDHMQAIAREMNLSETTFVFPPTCPDCVARVRIFTPHQELPFAGHPTVGTTWVLANRGLLPLGVRQLALEEGIGPVPVRIEGEDLSQPSAVWMAHRQPQFGPAVQNRADLAAAIGLTEGDLLNDQPIQTGSTGVLFLYIPLRSPEAVDRAQLDARALAAANTGQLVSVFVFAPDPGRGPARVYSRMFGAAMGITEDSATGSASGPLAAYVAERALVELPDGAGVEAVEMVSLQGNKMGRPSEIRMRVRLQDGRAGGIEVGGGVVPVFEGVLTLPS